MESTEAIVLRTISHLAQTKYITEAQKGALKDLMFGSDSRIMAAMDAYRLDQNLNELGDSLVRLAKSAERPTQSLDLSAMQRQPAAKSKKETPTKTKGAKSTKGTPNGKGTPKAKASPRIVPARPGPKQNAKKAGTESRAAQQGARQKSKRASAINSRRGVTETAPARKVSVVKPKAKNPRSASGQGRVVRRVKT